MPKRAKPQTPTSPQAKLGSVIKSARDAMRKDAGLNGDIDRIPRQQYFLRTVSQAAIDKAGSDPLARSRGCRSSNAERLPIRLR